MAEQGIAILFGPVRQMRDEVLNLLASGFAESLGTAEVDCVGLHQNGIELMLANDLAQAVTNPRAIPVSAIPVCRMCREFSGFAVRFAFRLGGARKRADLLDRADADAVRLPQRAIHRPGFGDAHFGAMYERGDIYGAGITVSHKTFAPARFQYRGLKRITAIGRITELPNWAHSDTRAMPSPCYVQEACMRHVPAIVQVQQVSA